MVNVTLENDNQRSSCDKERVDGDKVEEHNVGGLGNEEVETPRAGMVFASPEEVRNYYSKFAQREGFGIYRRSSRCRDDGKLNYFTLACARAGKRESTAKKKFSLRQSPKTNCKAKVNVALGSDGKFHLCHVILEHNHELSPGMFHSNRCKKSGGPRAQRRSKAKDPVEAIVHQNYPSLVGVATSCEIIPSGENYHLWFCATAHVKHRSLWMVSLNWIINFQSHLLCFSHSYGFVTTKILKNSWFCSGRSQCY